MFNGIHHVAIICSNYAVSKKFYANVLGLRVISEIFCAKRQSYKLDLALADGIQIELFCFQESPKRLTYPEAQGLRHLAFSVQNISNCKIYLEGYGVKVENLRLDEFTGRRFTFFMDPDGLPLELYEIPK
jgi:glyoxylase I family protein